MLKKLQKENKEWTEYNFPNKEPWHPLLGVVEEVGELAHAHLKMVQGIRRNEKLMDLAYDAVGDIIIYLADYCNQMNFDLEGIVKNTWDQVKQRNWKENPDTGKPMTKPIEDKIKELRKQDHEYRCIERQVWGDGLCECRIKYPLKIGK